MKFKKQYKIHLIHPVGQESILTTDKFNLIRSNTWLEIKGFQIPIGNIAGIEIVEEKSMKDWEESDIEQESFDDDMK